MERGCVGKVRRDRPELCESSTESRWPGTRRPVELITREMGTPTEERAGKEVLASALGSTRLPKQGPHPRALFFKQRSESVNHIFYKDHSSCNRAERMKPGSPTGRLMW